MGQIQEYSGIHAISIDAVKDNTADWSASGIYTLQGIKVAESKAQAATLPSGIYIVNGKKIVKE